jgi:4,5-DOPA dioxygenase extradiol
MLPMLFISHGSPDLLLSDHEVAHFLRNLSKRLPRPKQIIVISSHWVSERLEILSHETPRLIYDFSGFEPKLYQHRYPISNDLALVDRIKQAFQKRGMCIEMNRDRGYDHGVWSPLAMLYPDASIPVVQLSLPHPSSVEELMKIGEVLRPFREEGMIIASGNVTHNLSDLAPLETPVNYYAKDFRDWLITHLYSRSRESFQNRF